MRSILMGRAVTSLSRGVFGLICIIATLMALTANISRAKADLLLQYTYTGSPYSIFFNPIGFTGTSPFQRLSVSGSAIVDITTSDFVPGNNNNPVNVQSFSLTDGITSFSGPNDFTSYDQGTLDLNSNYDVVGWTLDASSSGFPNAPSSGVITSGNTDPSGAIVGADGGTIINADGTTFVANSSGPGTWSGPIDLSTGGGTGGTGGSGGNGGSGGTGGTGGSGGAGGTGGTGGTGGGTPPTSGSLSSSACLADLAGGPTGTIQPLADGTTMTASFDPATPAGVPITLQQAEAACGLSGFNWTQSIESIPGTSPYFGADGTQLEAPITSDPPEGGYEANPYFVTCNGSRMHFVPLPNTLGTNNYPFFFNAADLAKAAPPGTDSLLFADTPADPCLPDLIPGIPFSLDDLIFETTLVGVIEGDPDPVTLPLPLGFLWESNFDGTVGGTATLYNFYDPADPGSGTGGVQLLSIDGVPVPEPCTFILIITSILFMFVLRNLFRSCWDFRAYSSSSSFCFWSYICICGRSERKNMSYGRSSCSERGG
jgi:hypothetical protein